MDDSSLWNIYISLEIVFLMSLPCFFRMGFIVVCLQIILAW